MRWSNVGESASDSQLELHLEDDRSRRMEHQLTVVIL
jgi:hypothetical protein